MLQNAQVPDHQQSLSQQLQATAEQPCIPHQLTQSYGSETAAPIVQPLSTQQQAMTPQGTLQAKIVDKYIVLSSYSKLFTFCTQSHHSGVEMVGPQSGQQLYHKSTQLLHLPPQGEADYI